MHTFILVIHVVVALFLILIVLLQIGRAGSLGGLFGGGGGGEVVTWINEVAWLLKKIVTKIPIMDTFNALFIIFNPGNCISAF